MAELTTDAWAKKLATAYDAKYGAGECAKAVTAGKYANAGYMFVDKFLSNVSVDAGSEGTLAKDTANATKKMVGFSPVSKYSISDKTKDGVTTPATYPKVDFLTEMNGFGGYAYKFYTQVAKTTDRPYTAMLFINYLSTAEGVAHYQEGHGVYSSNTKVSPANNDPSLASVLEKCVVENYGDVKAKWAELKRLIESYQAQ